MLRSIFLGVLLIGLGAAAARIFFWWAPGEPVPVAEEVALADQRADRRTQELEREVRRLEAKLADESAERRRLAARIDAVAAQLASRSPDSEPADDAAGADNTASVMAAPEAPDGNTAVEPTQDDGRSEMERALTQAGLDPAAAAAIKQRHDALAMSEIYLRDEATRDEWIDTPRFAEEMAAIEAERRPIREEIGDDAYDRYLYALGQPNRVRVEDVLSDSPAEQVGLRAGDMVLRYGDARIFEPDELVTETRGGASGETVRLEVIRDGQRIEVDVPRGPLGLRISASQGVPS
jgi:hypothetical protein